MSVNVAERSDVLAALHAMVFPPKAAAPPPSWPAPQPVRLEDDALLRKMFAARNGAKIRRLFEGNTSDHGGDDSGADLALCNHLAFWTGGDAARIDRLFRASGLR